MSAKTPRETLTRGLMLLAILIALCFVVSKLDALIESAQSAFSTKSQSLSAKNAQDASDSAQSAYYKIIAGFWEHSSAKLYDRIEIKDNGIIWQYTEKTFDFPYDISKKITRVWTAFIVPTRFGENTSATSNMRVIRETYFMPDTCYGRNFYDIVANTRVSNDTLFFDNVPYTRYTGELSGFFPEGALSLVDDIRVVSCNRQNPLSDWLKEHLSAGFAGREIPYDAFKFERSQLLKNYYIPYCLARIKDAMIFERAYDLDLKVIVSPDGAVEKVVVSGKDFVSPASKKPIEREVETWKFPADGQNRDTVSFKGTFIKKQ